MPSIMPRPARLSSPLTQLRLRRPRAQAPERDQPPAPLVPEREPDAAQALAQGKAPDRAEFGVVEDDAAQAVEGDGAA